MTMDRLVKERHEVGNHVAEKYNWDKIAEQTIEVYQKAIA